MTEPLLNKQDLDSVTWKKIEDQVKKMLDNYRKINDNDLGLDLTCFTRGQINMCKQILEFNPENGDI